MGTDRNPQGRLCLTRVARYGRTPGENQKRQAYVPRGAIAIENPVGTAPAFIVETERNAVICLPGVPREMETLLNRAVIPYLQKRFELHKVIKVRLLHTSGVGESTIDEQIGDFETLSNPTVGLAAHSGIVDVRIAAKANSMDEADRMIAEVEDEIRRRLGLVIFGVDEDTLEGITLEAVMKHGWTLVALEAGLDGALSRRISSPKSPALVNVEALKSLEGGSLPDVTTTALRNHRVNVALGVALYPGDDQQTVEICLITPHGTQSRQLSYGGHPLNAPRWAVNMALDLLRLAANANV